MDEPEIKPLSRFHFPVVQEPLSGLLINMDRDLQRRLREVNQAGDQDGQRRVSLLSVMIRFAINSYEALCFVLMDVEDHPRRKPRFVLIVPPVNRQMLDLLFTLVYMMDDFTPRSMDYERAGYRQLREEYAKFHERFGSEPDWQPWFADQRNSLLLLETALQITPQQKADPTLIPYWKAPYRLKQMPTQSQPFLEFLEKWLYGDTSAEAHLNAGGLFSVSPFVLSSLVPDHVRQRIENRNIHQYKFRHFCRTVITLLAIATEIDTYCQLNNREQLSRLWTLMSGYNEEARDVYEERYRAMLSKGG